MELLFSVIVLIVLAFLAVRYGYDSRGVIQSKEHELACFGMAWPDDVPLPLVRPLSRRRRLRRKLALGLLAFADWLSPEAPRLARG